MTILWREPPIDLSYFRYSLGELNIAMVVDDHADDFILVNVVETSYARKWSLAGRADYQMFVNKSRILFCQENKRVVVGRGLLKWYCNSGNGQRGKVSPSENERDTFYLEISSDAARGPGIIEIYSVEKRDIQMGDWVHQRLFPNRTTECYQGLCRFLASCFGGIYYCFIVCHNFLRCKSNRTIGLEPQQIIIDPKDPKQRMSLDDDSDFPRPMDDMSKTSRSSIEAQASVDTDTIAPVKGNKPQSTGPNRVQSFKETMKNVPRKQSIKRIKSGMSKVVKNITQNKESVEGSSMSAYQSFEKLDDCFDIIDDESNHSSKLDYNRIFSIQSDEGGMDHIDDCVLDNVKDDTSSESMEDHALGDSLPTSNDSLALRNSWYDKRKSTEDLQIKPHTTVAFETSDNTVIVMDENDIYKVPQQESPNEEQFVSSCQIVVGKTAPFKAIVTPPEETTHSIVDSVGNIAGQYSPARSSSSQSSSEWDKVEEPHKQKTAITVEMSSQTNVSNPRPRVTKTFALTDEEGTDRVSSTRSVEEGLKSLVRPEPLQRYVEQSQSLMSLRKSSKVGSTIKQFDSSASPEKKPNMK